MKCKYLLSLLFILTIIELISGCSQNPTEPEFVNSFFPLEVGNKWYYNSSYPETSTITDVWAIIDNKNIVNKNYFMVIEQNLNANNKDTIYYRINGDTLFSKTKNYDEQIEADFHLNLNETAYWRNDLKVVEKTEDRITFETPFGGDYGYRVTFKKGIGISNLVSNGWVYRSLKLIKAEIK